MWREADVRVAQVFADMAASYVANASQLEESRRTTEELQEALDSLIIIEQAKGVIATELRCTVDQAFVVLRDQARRNGRACARPTQSFISACSSPPATTWDKGLDDWAYPAPRDAVSPPRSAGSLSEGSPGNIPQAPGIRIGEDPLRAELPAPGPVDDSNGGWS